MTEGEGPIDYIVDGPSGSSDGLLIALTGTSGYIDANHKKLAQLFGALAEVQDGQRLVFLVNASADDDPRTRAPENCITEPALKRMGKHEICILFTYDLYKLWVDALNNKMSADEIFRAIHSTVGLFKHESE